MSTKYRITLNLQFLIMFTIFIANLAGIKISLASEFAYTCVVKNVYDLEESGSVVQSKWTKGFIGSTFSVSRVTGEIIGLVTPTLMANDVIVTNSGNFEYSFKSISVYDNGHVQLIEVQEFIDKKQKPFIAVSMGGAGVVTGICQ